MAIYETIIILDSLMAPKEIDAAVERFNGIITENKGKVLNVDKWGKRRLAYEIKKKQYGFYVSIEFEAEGNIPNELESEFNYNDKVMRFLTYRFDKHKLRIWEEEKSKLESVPEAKTHPEPAAKPVPETTEAEAVPADVDEPEIEGSIDEEPQAEVTEDAGDEEEDKE